MEEKISNNNIIITCKSENEQDLQEIQFLKCEIEDTELEKKGSETNHTEPNVNVENNYQNNNEIVKNNSNNVSKRKATKDRVSIKKVLLEDKGPSGFEMVTSVDSKIDTDDLNLSSSFYEDNYNIIVKIKNELAFQNENRPDGRIPYHETRSKSSDWQNHKADYCSNEYGFETLREPKFQQRNNVDKYNFDKGDRESSERKNFDHSRQHTYTSDWSACRDHVRGSRRSKWDDLESRYMQSRSNERIVSFKDSKNPEGIVRDRSPNYKDTKTESRPSKSFDRNSTKLSPERSFPSRKKSCNSFTKSSSPSVWKQLDNCKFPKNIKTDEINNDKTDLKNSFHKPFRKKEQTLFVVDLEKKPKEEEPLKIIQQELNGSKDQTKASGNEFDVMPPVSPALNQSCDPSLSLTYMPNVQGAVYSVPCTPLPAVSVDNLPLVPGPTGLPVHITATGEQIPHDMDGRPIPIGPNGFYLPLDPMGRIFPHIVSPENHAVPIHMTEDGVLRLPNSEPVPFGPGHQLPINVDGRIIPIGPDSRPLYPCSGLPKMPPLNFLPVLDCNAHVEKTLLPPPPQMGYQETVQTKTNETLIENQTNVQPPIVDLGLQNFIQNPFEEIGKAELLNKHKTNTQERSEDSLNYIGVEKNLGVNFSEGGVKSSIPEKLSQKKTFRDDSSSSGSDMILDTSDSDSACALKPVIEQHKDKEFFKNPNFETKFEDCITEKIQRAIKLLYEKNYMPPTVGRFIVSDVNLVPSVYNLPNESPLLRNRIQLSFIVPNVSLNHKVITIKESEVNFKFLPQKECFENEEKHLGIREINLNSMTIPVFTLDFAMQCDFTSEIMKNLNFKISKLEMEVTRLKRINSSLFDGFKNIQIAKKKKAKELRKALLEIQEKNNEIRYLKRAVEISK